VSETHRYAPAVCTDGSTQKVKSNQFLLFSSPAAVSSQVSNTFSFYLGDNMAGITSPVKSMQYRASGVYTGGGSVTISLGGDSATAQTYTLPAVSAPTPIVLLYQDATGSTVPSSAGTYSYTFDTAPSGVTLYQWGVELIETHRYIPPPCSGMPIKGELYSAVFDTTGTTTGPAYQAMHWVGVLGGVGATQGKVRFQLAASDCQNGATNYPACSTGTWAFVGGATCSSADWFDPGAANASYDLQTSGCSAQWTNKRYFRYATQLCSDDCVVAGSFTPRVDDVIVSWSP
jgi:hypothetical protein